MTRCASLSVRLQNSRLLLSLADLSLSAGRSVGLGLPCLRLSVNNELLGAGVCLVQLGVILLLSVSQLSLGACVSVVDLLFSSLEQTDPRLKPIAQEAQSAPQSARKLHRRSKKPFTLPTVSPTELTTFFSNTLFSTTNIQKYVSFEPI